MNLPLALNFRTNRSPQAIQRLNLSLDTVLYSTWTLLLCKLIIGFVSAYDIFLTIKYVDFLPMLELNPIGRWLMMLDCGPECSLNQVAGFIASKFAGNFLVLVIIEVLPHWKRSLAVYVAVAVAIFQLMLLTYLFFGTF